MDTVRYAGHRPRQYGHGESVEMSRILDRLAAVQTYWNAYWTGHVPMLCAVQPKDPSHTAPCQYWMIGDTAEAITACLRNPGSGAP
jgi:hypothetical protein